MKTHKVWRQKFSKPKNILICWIRVHLFTGGIQDPIPFVYRRIQDPVYLITGGIQGGIKDPDSFVSGWNPGYLLTSISNVLTLDQYPIFSKAVKNKSDKG